MSDRASIILFDYTWYLRGQNQYRNESITDPEKQLYTKHEKHILPNLATGVRPPNQYWVAWVRESATKVSLSLERSVFNTYEDGNTLDLNINMTMSYWLGVAFFLIFFIKF